MVKIAQFWKSTSFSPKLLSLKFIAECPRWLISLKCLVYFHEYAEFDKIWSSKLTFISTETETANRTEPQYSQSETGLNRFGILRFFGHPNLYLQQCMSQIFKVALERALLYKRQ